MFFFLSLSPQWLKISSSSLLPSRQNCLPYYKYNIIKSSLRCFQFSVSDTHARKSNLCFAGSRFTHRSCAVALLITIMAANVPERWYFTKEQLKDTPSRRCELDEDKELSYRQQAATLIQDMGQRLSVYPSKLLSTGSAVEQNYSDRSSNCCCDVFLA